MTCHGVKVLREVLVASCDMQGIPVLFLIKPIAILYIHVVMETKDLCQRLNIKYHMTGSLRCCILREGRSLAANTRK